MYNYIYITGWWFWATPLKNDGVRQWEGWHDIYEMENKSHVWNHEHINFTVYGDFGDGLLLGSTGFAIKYREFELPGSSAQTSNENTNNFVTSRRTVLNGTYYDWMLDVKNIVNQSSYLTHSAFNISSQVRFTDPSTLQHFAQKVLSEDKDQQVHDVPHAWDDKLPAHHSSPQQLDIHVHHRVWNNGWITGCRDPLDGRGEFALLILQHVPSRWCHHHRNHQKKPSPLFKTFKTYCKDYWSISIHFPSQSHMSHATGIMATMCNDHLW